MKYDIVKTYDFLNKSNKMNLRKRKDELFFRRIAFYCTVISVQAYETAKSCRFCKGKVWIGFEHCGGFTDSHAVEVFTKTHIGIAVEECRKIIGAVTEFIGNGKEGKRFIVICIYVS